jgi:hypothetical protein
MIDVVMDPAIVCKWCFAGPNVDFSNLTYLIRPHGVTAYCKNARDCQNRQKARGMNIFNPGPPYNQDPPKEEMKVSEARWCDYRDHPYKGGREGTVMMGRTETQPNGGQSYTQNVKEMCPECAAELGLNEYEAPKQTPAERRALLQTEVSAKGHGK